MPECVALGAVSAQNPAIAGSWINGAPTATAGPSFEVINPATGAVAATYALATVADVDAAVAAAEAAVGLGIILALFRNKETVNIDEMNVMRW